MSERAVFEVTVIDFDYTFTVEAAPMYTVNHERKSVFKIRVDETDRSIVKNGVVYFSDYAMTLVNMEVGDVYRMWDSDKSQDSLAVKLLEVN